MNEKNLHILYNKEIDFKIEEYHKKEVEEKIEALNIRRIKRFGLLTVVIELFLILFVDLPLINKGDFFAKYYLYLHALVIIVSLGILWIAKKYKKDYFKNFYSIFPEIVNSTFMIFMVMISYLDQKTQGNIITYISMLLVCGTVIFIKPPRNYFIYTFSHIIMMSVLYLNFPMDRNIMANMVNGTIFYICMLFVSRYIYLNQYVHFMKNIILQDMNDKMVYLLNYDNLTGIANRRYFEELINKKISENNSGFLVIMDVDYFKYVNDNFGHHAGDEVLVKMTRKLSQFIEKDDLLARWGGEEFIFYLARKELEEGLKSIDNIRKSIENLEIDYKGSKIKVTASFGMTKFLGQKEEDYNRAFSYADEALYQAKLTGRNKVVYKGEQE